jgi:nucleoside-diphosphate-sugar epimerase
MDKVFVTGGSGFLGINLIRHLLERDYEIISYDIIEFDYPEKDKIVSIVGDIRDKDKLFESMKGADIVVHTAAALPLYSKKNIFTTDVDGTENVLSAALRHGINRVVHISSTAVYGIPDHHPLLENDKLIGVGPYGKAKIFAEEKCLEYRKKGLTVPILRPKSFIGPERLGVFALFYDWAKDGCGFPILGNGDNLYQFLDVEDLCEATYLCMIGEESIVNDIFNIGAKEYKTMKEDYQAVLDYTGFNKKIRPIPAWPAILILRILEFFKLSPLYKWVYETAAKDSFVSIEKAERILKFTPKYSNQDALIRNYKWYIDNLDSFEKKSGISHRVPWKQGILKLLKIFF